MMVLSGGAWRRLWTRSKVNIYGLTPVPRSDPGAADPGAADPGAGMTPMPARRGRVALWCVLMGYGFGIIFRTKQGLLFSRRLECVVARADFVNRAACAHSGKADPLGLCR